MSDREAIPHRLRERGRHGAKLVGSILGAGAKRLFSKSDDDDRALGEALFKELDEMKGMAMKVGQILSYLDALPPETQAVLTRLQRGVSPIAFDTIRAVVEQAFGPLEQAFERFDEVAVAAASIGQVHRARFQGREVAVKVRYPHVAATFDEDVQKLRRLAGVASLATAVDGQAIVDELHARLQEECDYASEARWQRTFRDAFAHDPVLVVPEVIDARSSHAVLCTAWFDGQSFEALREAPQARRDDAGLALARFAWHSLFRLGTLHADPHPGNFLFAEQKVAVLDFGCVRSFPSDFLGAWRRTFQAVLDDDRPAFEEAVRASGLVGRRRFDFGAHWDFVAYSLEPYRAPRFRFTKAYAAELKRFSGPRAPNQLSTSIPPPWIWIARLHFGLHAVLARLEAEGPFADVMREALSSEPARGAAR